MTRWAEQPEREQHEGVLRFIEEERKELENSLERLQRDRDNAIREAVAAGLTQAAVARATDLTRSRVGQIVSEE